MSSFASRAREEIAQRSIQKDCCVRAAAYGIACFAKYFDAKGLVVQTEQQETVQAAQQLFARCGVQGEILHKQRPSGVLYEFNIRAPEQVLPGTRELMARLLGLSRESLSRELNKLAREGAIRLERRRVELLGMVALERRAQD